MINLKKELYIELYKFIENIKCNKIELYNEFNLQFEIAYFLRNKGYKVEFERNVGYFGLKKEDFIKKEIDLVVYGKDDIKIPIELKYPNNGQVPEQMFSFIKDIRFLEQLKETEKFKDGIFFIITQNPNFWEGNSEKNKLYESFRIKHELNGEYCKPTGLKDKMIKLEGYYSLEWISIGESGFKFLLPKVINNN